MTILIMSRSDGALIVDGYSSVKVIAQSGLNVDIFNVNHHFVKRLPNPLTIQFTMFDVRIQIIVTLILWIDPALSPVGSHVTNRNV